MDRKTAQYTNLAPVIFQPIFILLVLLYAVVVERIVKVFTGCNERLEYELSLSRGSILKLVSATPL